MLKLGRIKAHPYATRSFRTALSLDGTDLAATLERDHAAASAEYLAEFRTDIEGFVSYEIVQSCVGDHVEMAPLSKHRYRAFTDPAGGSGPTASRWRSRTRTASAS